MLKIIDNKTKDLFSVDLGSDTIYYCQPHPEILFDDMSELIFPNVESYYKFIGNAEVYNADNTINFDNLLSQYETETETPENEIIRNHHQVSVIIEIKYVVSENERYTLVYLMKDAGVYKEEEENKGYNEY
jgi:hypothetical protein